MGETKSVNEVLESGETKSINEILESSEKEHVALDVEKAVSIITGPIRLNDSEDPRKWAFRRKLKIIAFITIFITLSPLASSMCAPSTPLFMKEFHETSPLKGSFALSVYILGYATGPLVIGPLSEIYGRFIIYEVSIGISIIFLIGCGLAQNMGALIGLRFLAGVAGSCPISLGSASIGDLVHPYQRGRVQALLSIGPSAGPAIGPIIGGFLSAAKGWRWVYWLLSLLTGFFWILSFFFLEETYAPVLLERKIKRLSDMNVEGADRASVIKISPFVLIARTIARPLQMLLFNPIVTLLSIYSAFVYGVYYMFLTTMSGVFETKYHFSQSTVGLAYIGLGLGACIGGFSSGFASDAILKRVAPDGEVRPEARLIPMMPASLFTPVGLFWYGWSIVGGMHWIMPIVGTFWVGIGLSASFMPLNYLIDAYPRYAASAVAANSVLRSVGGAFLPLAGPSLRETLGYGWSNSLLAFLSLLAFPMAVLLHRYGERLRARSRYGIET